MREEDRSSQSLESPDLLVEVGMFVQCCTNGRPPYVGGKLDCVNVNIVIEIQRIAVMRVCIRASIQAITPVNCD